MGTNTSKPCAYAENNSRTASCEQGVRYVNMTYGGNGVSRMGGVHTKKTPTRSSSGKENQTAASQSRSNNTAAAAHLPYRHDDSDADQVATGRVRGDTSLDEPLPPYSR